MWRPTWWHFLWRVFLWNLGMPCLVFFLGTTSHIMTPCAGFPFFWFFLNLLCSHFKSRSNSRCPPCVLGGWRTQVCDRFWVPHLQGTSKYFSPNFFMCGLCSPRSNLNLNGFSSKIIQYMDITRDNSSNLGSGIPTRSSTHENWSARVLHTALASHFTKKHPF
jgi:hypothetical protein